MDMKKILQALDSASEKPAVDSNDMKKFLRVVAEGAPVAQQQSPEQIAYNQLRAQLDSADSLRGGANTYTDVSPEVAASTAAMKQKLAQMAAALKAKGIDAEAEYNAPDASVPAAAPVDLNKYNDQDAAPVAEEVGMSRLLSIITEGKGPLNRPTAAETLAMQHFAETKKTITNPVLNVQEDAKPSMIGKYFKAVEQELREAAEKPNERAQKLAQRVIERIVPNADGSLPDPSINRLTGKPNPPAAEPAPTNVKPSGSTVDYGGATYNLVGVFGDGIRPRIGRGDKVIPAKAYVLGDKMYVLLDQGVAEDDAGDVEQRMLAKMEKEKQRLAKLKQTDPEAYKREMAKRKTSGRVPPVSTFEDQDVAEVAGPEKCWPGHRKVGTKPGTGKNAGKRVNDCEKIGEATSAAQQAAIAIAKKKAGKK